MSAALELAERGRRSAHPNPLVGAVVVAAGEVVGRGFHRGPGTAHAEVVALDEAGGRARGATLFVTLEPCCTQGRTPPCTERIIADGVGRVVAAMRDPNPQVDGRGFARLRAAGVDVDLAGPGVSRRAEALNRAFTKYMHSSLPFVTLKAAVSLDGKVAAAGGDARWISSPASRRRVHEMRAAADAVMVGAGTVRRDDPLLTVRDAPGDDPVRVVVSRHGQIPLEAAVVAGARRPQTIVVGESVAAAQEAALRERGVDVIQTGGAGLDSGLRALAQRGLLDILCEGGPELGGALIAAGLVDQAQCLRGATADRARSARSGGAAGGRLGLAGLAYRRSALGDDRSRCPLERSRGSQRFAGRRRGGRSSPCSPVSSKRSAACVHSASGVRRRVLEIEAATVLEGTRVGDSIATSGVCLTVTRLAADRFWADAMPETVRRTTLAGLRPGAPLNLERALALGGRLGGHLVPGHVDGIGKRARRDRRGERDRRQPARARRRDGPQRRRRVRSPSTASA